MLEKVAEQINVMTKNVVIRHPNTMNCLVYGQKILRKDPEQYSGIPTLGGLGVMDEDDEVYRLLCSFDDVDFDRFFRY